MLVPLHATACDRRHSIVATTIACCLFLVASDWSSGADGEPMFQRFAIMATGDIQATGLSDLLTAKLSAVAGVELVEREQLASAIKEQELSAYFNSTAAPQRLKLGQLLEADVLILLSTKAPDAVVGSGAAKPSPGPRPAGARPTNKAGTGGSRDRSLRLVISDCVFGARLHVEYIPFETDALDAMATECVSAILQTRQRFASGVEHMIGVTHFLSKNLTYEYDHLQAGYAMLLENALRAFPGVAVIEIDEARAIGDELRLSGAKLKNRSVPFFVEGEFEMSAAQPGESPTVRLAMRAGDGRRVHAKAERSGLAEDDVVELLTNVLPSRLLALSTGDASPQLSRNRQREMLVARAGAFSHAGQWRHAIALREAALLVAPDDVDQKIELISDYRHWNQSRHMEASMLVREMPRELFRKRIPREEVEREVRKALEPFYKERVSRLVRVSRLIEDVLRRRAVNPREAGMLASFFYEDVAYQQPLKRQDQQIAYDIFWNLYRHFPKLDYEIGRGTIRPSIARAYPRLPAARLVGENESPAGMQFRAWTNGVADYVLLAAPRFSTPATLANRGTATELDDSQTLDTLHRFLVDVAPQTWPLDFMARYAMSPNHSGLLLEIRKGRFQAEEIRRFYQRLEQSEQPLNQFYGRCGLLGLDVYAGDNTDFDVQDLQARVDAEKQFLREWQRTHRFTSLEPFNRLNDLRSEIARRRPGVKQHELTANPIPPFDPSPRVRFEPTMVDTADWEEIVKCNDELDAMRSRTGVYVMRESGVVHQALQLNGRRDRVLDIEWDGENVWAATAQSGISVISSDGDVVASIHTEQGLPPYDVVKMWSVHKGTLYRHPLLLHAISPGRCLAMGRFGQEGRVWIATLSDSRLAGDASVDARDSSDAMARRPQYDVKVIHKATKLSSDGTDDAEEIFDPVWISEYSPPGDPARRTLLVGRGQRPGERQGRRPLVIDLDTLEVRVHPGRLPAYGDTAMLPIRDLLASAVITGIDIFRPGSDGEWASKSIFSTDTNHPILPQLIRVDDTLFNPGRHWRRANLEEVELLNETLLPHRHAYQRFGLSAHYGLVAWNMGDRLQRVLIDEPPEPSVDSLASEYFYVPEAARQEHAHAVQTIRDLGGSVDALWGVPRSQLRYFAAGPDNPTRPWVTTTTWYTIVFLPKDWRGGDGGLEHLRRLHNLRAIWMVEADVTDEGLRHLERLETLELLQLQETKVTDAGLVHLRGLSSLAELWLEGRDDGSDLTDAGLAHLTGHSKLERLTVYGNRFTDEFVSVLETMNQLRHVCLLETSITADAIEKLKRSKPSLSVRSNPQ